MGGEQTDGKSDQPVVPSVSTSAWCKVLRIPRASYQSKEWFTAISGLFCLRGPASCAASISTVEDRPWCRSAGARTGSQGQQSPALPAMECSAFFRGSWGAFPSHPSPTHYQLIEGQFCTNWNACLSPSLCRAWWGGALSFSSQGRNGIHVQVVSAPLWSSSSTPLTPV